MTTDYEIQLIGTGSQSDLVITDIIDASINLNESAISDFSATVPKTDGIREYLQNIVKFYNQDNDEVVWEGYLESWEEGATDAKSSISGRGRLVEDENESINYTVESDWADDALDQYLNNSNQDFEFVSRSSDDRETATSGIEQGLANTAIVEDSEDMRAFTSIQQGDGTDKGTLTEVKSGNATNDVEYSGNHAWRFTGASKQRDNGDNINTKTLDFTFEESTPNGQLGIGTADIAPEIRLNVDDGEDIDLDLLISGDSSGIVYSDTASIDNTSGSPTHEWVSFPVGGSSDIGEGEEWTIELDFNGEIDSWIDIDAIAIIDDSSDAFTSESLEDEYYVHPAQYAEGPSTTEEQLTLSTSDTFGSWNIAVKYEYLTGESVVGVSNTSGSADNTTTVSADENEVIHTSVDTSSDTDSPYVFVTLTAGVPDSFTESGQRERARIEKISVWPTESEHRYITTEEINGSILSGTKRLSEIAGYRFSSKNWNASQKYIAFPIGHEVAEPDWRILDGNRSSDWTNYFNEVRVRGASPEDSETVPDVTLTDEGEVSAVGKTVQLFDKRTDLTTQAGVRAVAQTLLDESVQNRGEAGGLTTTLPTSNADTIVGASMPVSIWNETFTDGGMTGENALRFEQLDGDVSYVDLGSSLVNTSDDYRFEFELFAHLDEMDNGVVLLSTDYRPDMLVLTTDGALEARPTDSSDTDPPTISTGAGTIDNRVTYSVAYDWDDSTGELSIDVDGSTEASSTLSGVTFSADPGDLIVGNRRRDSFRDGAYRVWQNTSVLLTLDADSMYDDSGTTTFRNYAADDSVDDAAEIATDWSVVSAGDAAYREGIESGNSNQFQIPHDDALDIGQSNLAAAAWFKTDDLTNTERYYIFDKGGRTNSIEGWAFSVEGTGSGATVQLEVSDGSSRTEHTVYTGDDIEEDTWHHVGFILNYSAGFVDGYVDGERRDRVDYDYTASIDNSGRDLSILAQVDDGSLFLDEVRIWNAGNPLPQEMATLAELGPGYDDVYHGGLDEFKYLDDGTLQRHFRFDDSSTPDTAIDAEDNEDGVINNIAYGATHAPPREISYNFFGDATADVKFDIAGRVDTELNDVRKDLGDVKR